MAEQRDLPVPGGDGAVLPARFYRPHTAAPDAPMMVYFHGGGFTFCDVGTHDALCRRLAHGAGIRVLSVGYRLAPEHPYPTQYDDALAAARFVAGRPAQFGGDHGLILGGDSAGGYLALAATRRMNADVAGTVMLTLLIYPLLQLDDDQWASSLIRDYRVVGRIALVFIRNRLAHPAPSLLGADLRFDPPSVVTCGGLDPVKPDAMAYAGELEQAGVPVWRLCHPQLPHGYANFTHVLKASRQAVDETVAALAEAVAHVRRGGAA